MTDRQSTSKQTHQRRVIRYADAAKRAELQDTLSGYYRRRIFQEVAAIPLATKLALTTEQRRQADRLYSRLDCPGYKQSEKRRQFHLLFQSLLLAHCHKGAIMFSRRRNQSRHPNILMQIIDQAVKHGLAREVRSKPGHSDHQSRLLPTPELIGGTLVDPWTVDPDPITRFVYLYQRQENEDEERVELDFDPNHPIARSWQRKLEHINHINAGHTITYYPLDAHKGGFSRAPLRLRPVHFASFTDSFQLHGRIYTGKFGHQGLHKMERFTIEFDGERGVELDYSGLHARMLYHLQGINYREDPYKLWDKTTEPMRLLAKVYLNALINAQSPQAARDACNYKMSPFTRSREERGRRHYKSGQALEKAGRLLEAARVTGLKFADLYPLVLRKHARIADQFGQDQGIQLMRIDAEIALTVLYHFAKRCIPCLGCHDSFLVPQHAQAELIEVMSRAYQKRLGFLPILPGV